MGKIFKNVKGKVIKAFGKKWKIIFMTLFYINQSFLKYERFLKQYKIKIKP